MAVGSVMAISGVEKGTCPTMPALDTNVPLLHPSLEPLSSDGGIEPRGVATIDSLVVTRIMPLVQKALMAPTMQPKRRATIAIGEDGTEGDTAPSEGGDELVEPDIDVRLGTIIVMVRGDSDVMLTEDGSESVIDLSVSDELVAVLDDVENLDTLTVLTNERLVARGLEGPSLGGEVEPSLSDWEEDVCAVCGYCDHGTFLTCGRWLTFSQRWSFSTVGLVMVYLSVFVPSLVAMMRIAASFSSKAKVSAASLRLSNIVSGGGSLALGTSVMSTSVP
jgi:hypothetical protein